MTHDQILAALAKSQPEDWYEIPAVSSGDSFLSTQSFWTRGEEIVGVDEKGHYARAAYRPDVSLGLAWGLQYQDDFTEGWTDVFPDKSASSQFVDVLWNGMLVDRHLHVVVDGGRSAIPLPDRKLVDKQLVGYWLSARDHHLGRLIAGIKGDISLSTYDEYINRAGIVVE